MTRDEIETKIQRIYEELEILRIKEKAIVLNGTWKDAGYQSGFITRSELIIQQIKLLKKMESLRGKI